MDNPIRVLHIFTILNRGGAESMIMNYYRNIDRSKVQFDFLVHRDEVGVFEDEIKKLGGRIFRMPPINPLFLKPYNKALKFFFKINNYLIVHSHINTFSYYPLKVAKEAGVKYRISHAHTTTQNLSIKRLLKNPFDTIKIVYKNSRRLLVKKNSTHLFSCGKLAGDWLFGDSFYEILPNAINANKYIYNKNKSVDLREEYGLSNSFIIGHVGNFSYPKNYPFILNVFKKIKEFNELSKLVLIGNGTLIDDVRKLAIELRIIDDILFLGVRNDVPDLMQMMDVFLFPSFYEGLPVTLIEAQASGLKVFTSDNVTEEVILSEDIQRFSLNESYSFWAKRIIEVKEYNRKNAMDIIKENNYDVVDNAVFLQDFYLKLLK